MNIITFGFMKANASMANKLIVCNETKQYERGQCCVNTSYVDVWVKMKDIETIEKSLIADGYAKTDERFGK